MPEAEKTEDPWCPPDGWVSALEAALAVQAPTVTVRVSMSAGKTAYRALLDATCYVHRVLEDTGTEHVFLELEEAGARGERGAPVDLATHLFGRAAEAVLAARRLDGGGPVREARLRLQVFDAVRTVGDARDRVSRAALLGDEDAAPLSSEREVISEQVVLKCLEHLHSSAKEQAEQFRLLQAQCVESAKTERDLLLANLRSLFALQREATRDRIEAAKAASSDEDDGLASLLMENAEGVLDVLKNVTSP